ncbi:MAG: tetratricopeptide repeat protein, partial [Nitrospinaceae bacterium]
DAEAGFRQLREAAGKNPDDPNPLSMWGHYLEAAGRLEEARQRYQEALQIDGQHAPSHFRLGRLYLKMGMQPRAEAALKKAVELDPKAPEYLETLASYFLEQQRPMEAIDMLERVSVLQPDRMDLYVRLGNLYQKQGHHREAADRYWEAASIEPGNSEVHRHLRDLFQVLVEEEKKKLEQLRKNRAVAQSQPGR